jgi:hypothetical protein
MTPHRKFRNLDKMLHYVDNKKCLIVDMWNFWQENENLSHDGIYKAGSVIFKKNAIKNKK